LWQIEGTQQSFNQKVMSVSRKSPWVWLCAVVALCVVLLGVSLGTPWTKTKRASETKQDSLNSVYSFHSSTSYYLSFATTCDDIKFTQDGRTVLYQKHFCITSEYKDITAPKDNQVIQTSHSTQNLIQETMEPSFTQIPITSEPTTQNTSIIYLFDVASFKHHAEGSRATGWLSLSFEAVAGAFLGFAFYRKNIGGLGENSDESQQNRLLRNGKIIALILTVLAFGASIAAVLVWALGPTFKDMSSFALASKSFGA
jgi:hypothetical protein